MAGLDCCLVLMPYVDLRSPSLALGLLQAILKGQGFSARTVHACLDFAEMAGLGVQYQVMKGGRWLAGDWSFARAAFGPDHLDDEGYLRFVFERWVRRYPARELTVDPERFRQGLLNLRAQADRFVAQLTPRILAMGPRVVACSSTFQQHVASLALLRAVKAQAPEVVTLLGGANCEGEMGLATHVNFPWVDYVVSGEADELIGPLMGQILRHGPDAPPQALPHGVFCPAHRRQGYPKAADGAAPRAVVASLDDSPTPDYADYFEQLDQKPALREAMGVCLPFETSRGCWWACRPGGGCSFCGLNGVAGGGYTRKKPAQALEGLRALLAAYPARRVRMCDNVIDPGYYKSFLPKLAQAPWMESVRLFYEVRSDLTPAKTAALRRAGVMCVQPGVESLDSRCLALMNKGRQAWQHIQTLKACLQNGVSAVWHILHGFPGERDEWYADMARIIPLLHHLEPPNMFMSFSYHRFSHYWRNAAALGLDLAPLTDYRYVYPLPAPELARLAYHFETPAEESFALNPLAPFFGYGQGLEAAEHAFLRWSKAFWGQKERPRLIMRPIDDGLAIEDSRAVATERETLLHGLEAAAYQLAAEAPTMGRLRAALAAQGHAATAIQTAIERLQDSQIALLLDGRLLALATPPPAHALPNAWQQPGGHILARQYDQNRRAAGQASATEGP